VLLHSLQHISTELFTWLDHEIMKGWNGI
jgi:hypothetical protein